MMLSSPKTTAEQPSCPYAHAQPSQGAVPPTREPEPMPAAEAALLRRYVRIYASSCAALLALSLAGVAIALYASLAAGLALTALSLGLLGAAVLVRWRELRAHREIPGPRPTFFLGNMKDLLAHGHSGRDRTIAELHARFGPVVRLHLCWGSRPYVSLSIPSRTLFRKDLDSVRRADRTLLPISLMGIELGETHQRHRRDLMPFLNGPAAQAKVPVVRELSRSYVDAWRAGRHVHGDLKADLMHWSAHCLGAVLFGGAWDRSANLTHYLEAIATFDEEVSMRTFHPFFERWLSLRRRARISTAYRRLYDFLEQVHERRGEGEAAEAHTVHDRLVSLETAGEWTRAECIEELMSLVLGGTDAMSALMAQAMTLLADTPELQEQARRALGESGDGEAHPTVRAILNETMRLYPPVPFSSKFAQEPVTEQGRTIPAGTSLMWMKSVVGRNAGLFDEPERFVPERFSTSASQRQRESVANVAPFGAGPRHCIGKHLAEAQCATLLSAVLSNLRLVPIRDVEVQLLTATSVSPSTIPVRLEPLA